MGREQKNQRDLLEGRSRGYLDVCGQCQGLEITRLTVQQSGGMKNLFKKKTVGEEGCRKEFNLGVRGNNFYSRIKGRGEASRDEREEERKAREL